MLHSVGIGCPRDCDDTLGPYISVISLLIGYDNEAAPARDQALLTQYIIKRKNEVMGHESH